ncbi:MAG TPA: cupin domain-containing protein [Phycisphaerales bacterium]|nr:cupin domain-containing protein [Phycisphaerales bacterium]
MMRPINLDTAFASFAEHWSPRIAAELNGQHVKLVKLRGEFVWHHHEHEDELFLVHRGVLRMQYRDIAGDAASEREVLVHPGEFVLVPRTVEHRPCAAEEVEVVLFEPAGTLNTGNVRDGRTVERPARLGG